MIILPHVTTLQPTPFFVFVEERHTWIYLNPKVQAKNLPEGVFMSDSLGVDMSTPVCGSSNDSNNVFTAGSFISSAIIIDDNVR